MATVNATLSNFFGVAELSYRGIGSGETRSHPSIPTFMQNVGKVQGVNYASAFSDAVMGKGSLTNAVNDYSEEKDSFKTEFNNAMDNAKKTAGGLNSLDYSGKKNSPLNALAQSPIGFSNTDKNQNTGSKVFADRVEALREREEEQAKRLTKDENADEGNENEAATGIANESRTTPPFQAEIEDAAPKEETSAIGVNPLNQEQNLAATDAVSADASRTAGTVSNLMEDYNDTVGFLQSRMGTSGAFDHFASSFGNAPELADDMDKIGVQLEPATGMVSVDTKTLSDAIKDSPDSVQNILGKNGFGGAVERSAEAGKFGEDRMFPSLTESFGGGNDNLKGMYSPLRQVTSTPRGNLGNFMDTNY